MKPLLVMVYHHVETNLEGMRELVADMERVEVQYTVEEEVLVKAMTAQLFDLLTIDLNLPSEQYKRAQQLCNLLYPDAAYTELDLEYKPFLKFKLTQLWEKWVDAQRDEGPHFWDGIV